MIDERGIEPARAALDKNDKTSLWPEKYAPTRQEDLIGNKTSLALIREWLEDWQDVQFKDIKKTVTLRRGQTWANAPKPNAKALLLSGPPGIGKSSCVRILARELGYDVKEFNASDQRSKKVLSELLKPSIDNKSILEYKGVGTCKRTLFVMDEVDGLGAGDRGGVTAIIAASKTTKVPLVLICNDGKAQKLASLANYCYLVNFAPLS